MSVIDGDAIWDQIQRAAATELAARVGDANAGIGSSKWGKLPATMQDVANLVASDAAGWGVLVRVMKALETAHAERLAALEQQLAEVKSFPIEYVGTHETGRMYERNKVVTHAGSMWIALRTTQQRPGDGDGWRLAVKAGRDGKDAR